MMARLFKKKDKQNIELRMPLLQKRRVLVTFDIDGTLLKSIQKPIQQLQCRAFSFAFSEVFGLRVADFEAIRHHGQTDPFILVHTLVHHGLPYNKAHKSLAELKKHIFEYWYLYVEDIARELQVLPGVTSLLQLLASNGVTIGLATGDFEQVAWLKLEVLGLCKYFTEPNVGGFGDDHMERRDLVRIAGERAKKLYSKEPFDLRVHVGDTPNDIRAAEHAGALAVGVCTGVFAAEDLMEASNGNAVILPDLTNAQAFMNLLGI